MDPEQEVSRDLANEAIEMIDGYYPEFLADAGVIDSPVGRVLFYKSMIEAVQDDQMFPDSQAQQLIIDELGVKLGIAFEDMLRAARQRFNKQ